MMSGFGDYDKYDGLGLAELVRKKQVKPVELVEEAISRIEKLNPRLNAVIHKMYDLAREAAEGDLATISGQHPVTTRAKRSIAAFRLRTGMPIGLKVTLRGKRMYDFFDKLVNAVLPRIREFRGVSGNSFDGWGNYTLGLKEQTVFPEIEYDKIDKARGLEVSIITTAKTDEEGRHLLELLGMPFAKD